MVFGGFQFTILIEMCSENMAYPSLLLIHFNSQLDSTRLYHELVSSFQFSIGSPNHESIWFKMKEIFGICYVLQCFQPPLP